MSRSDSSGGDAPVAFDALRGHFLEACSLDDAARDAYVTELERTDPTLGGELRALLAADVRTGNHAFLRPPTVVVDAVRDAAEIADAEASGSARRRSGQHTPGMADGSDSAWRSTGGTRASRATAELPEGFEVGPFRVVRAITSGGMGTVHEARQQEPDRRVALKVLHDGAGSRRSVQRFRLEAEVLARLDHPAIASVIASGTIEDGEILRPWLAVEFIEDARPIVARAAEIEGIRERVELLRPVVDAIRHAHQRGVIHRDLKPGNVLVGSDGRVRVIDFGIARAEGLERATGSHTVAGELVGTLASMAPEQYRGDPGAIDVRCDVYGLGLLLWELLAGRRPIDLGDASLTEAIRRVTEYGVPRLDLVDTGDDEDLRSIVATATAITPSDRYPSAEALLADIDAWLAGAPITARPPGVTRRLRMLARRHRATTAAAAVALVGLTAAIAMSIGFTVRLADESNRRQSALERSERMVRFMSGVVGAGTDSNTDEPERHLIDALQVASMLAGDEFADDPDALLEIRTTIAAAFDSANQWTLAIEEIGLAVDLADDIAAVRGTGVAEDPRPITVRMRRGLYETGRRAFTAADSVYAEIDEMLDRVPAVRPRYEDALREHRLYLELLRGNRAAADGFTPGPAPEIPDDPDRADTIPSASGVLGERLYSFGHPKVAEVLLRRDLERTRRLGPLHPAGIAALNRHSLCLAALDRHDEAIDAVEAAIRKAVTLHGEDHPRTLALRTRVATIVTDAGRYDEGSEIMQDVLERRTARLGIDHPATVASRRFLRSNLARTGRLAEAVELGEADFASLQRVHGPTDRRTLETLQQLWKLMARVDRAADAIPLIDATIEAADRDGINAGFRALLEIDGAVTRIHAGRRDEARTMLEAAEAMVLADSNIHRSTLVRARMLLARELVRDGQPEAALEMVARTREDAATVLDIAPFDRARLAVVEGEAHAARRDWIAAHTAFRAVGRSLGAMSDIPRSERDRITWSMQDAARVAVAEAAKDASG